MNKCKTKKILIVVVEYYITVDVVMTSRCFLSAEYDIILPWLQLFGHMTLLAQVIGLKHCVGEWTDVSSTQIENTAELRRAFDKV